METKKNTLNYRFKDDYFFNNDIYNVGVENTASWSVKKGEIVFGNPAPENDETLKGMIGLEGEKGGWVEAYLLEEVK